LTPRKRNTWVSEEDRSKRIRAVYYVRQSTEGQDDLLSPEAQVRRIDAFAERDGVDMVGGYEDIAISGSSTENRPGFQRMIAHAKSPKRPFDMIIVYDLSRFSRKTLDLLQYIAVLKKHGVKLQSVTEPHYGDAASDESWIHTSAGNESLLPKTAKKTRDSQFEALERGYHPGGPPPFGFKTEDVVVKTRRLTPGGRERERETVHSKLVPDWGGEGDWVATMYEMNNEGHSTAAVAHYLREQGVKTRSENDFTPGSVGYILRNPRNFGKQERGQQSVSEYLPHDEIATKEEAHEPIVSPEVWDKAQEMLESRRPNSNSRESDSGSPEGKSGSPRSNSSPSRFSGLTKCGDCGSPTNLAAERTLGRVCKL
jgi:DNA invertase Pin-like site-specific DNA recombinase